DYYCAHDGF
nr:immunoglobulin light chain junction region [Macaca mulatta]